MESTEAWVLRSTSVSSIRSTIAPPLCRAYSQLKMKVRALPMCRKPVGEGAKRTRVMKSQDTGATADMAFDRRRLEIIQRTNFVVPMTHRQPKARATGAYQEPS